jgi:hypothetical protein
LSVAVIVTAPNSPSKLEWTDDLEFVRLAARAPQPRRDIKYDPIVRLPRSPSDFRAFFTDTLPVVSTYRSSDGG